MQIIIEALCIRAQNGNSPNIHQLVNDNKILCIDTLEHYSVIKKKYYICYNVDAPEKHAKWKNPETQHYMRYDWFSLI